MKSQSSVSAKPRRGSGPARYFRSNPTLEAAIEAAQQREAERGRELKASDVIRDALLASPYLFPDRAAQPPAA